MLSYTTEIRVRYADTDKMQFVYNGKYLEYFEVGRTELLRSTGLAYSEVEKNGYQLPLIEAKVQYFSPATYDDILQITASLSQFHSPRVHIEYEIKRKEDGTLIAKGYTTHVFIRADTKKAVRPPKMYVEALKKYFE